MRGERQQGVWRAETSNNLSRNLRKTAPRSVCSRAMASGEEGVGLALIFVKKKLLDLFLTSNLSSGIWHRRSFMIVGGPRGEFPGERSARAWCPTPFPNQLKQAWKCWDGGWRRAPEKMAGYPDADYTAKARKLPQICDRKETESQK